MEMKTTSEVFENPVMREVTGETIRPGGFYLTDRALEYLDLPAGARVLDVGCGAGATVERLRKVYNLQAYGVDPSDVLLACGRQKDPQLPLLKASGEELPFSSGQMDAVLAECTLSLMTDADRALGEIRRVLKVKGRLAVNDIYARNPEGVGELRQLAVHSFLRGALTRRELTEKLESQGFDLILWEDHTELLKQLTARAVWTHGSLERFWLKSSACPVGIKEILPAVAKAQMGYFLLIAQKK